MPRISREKSRSGIYHIMLRGINRQTIFEDEKDNGRFLDTLKEYKDVSGYKLYAYCLMGNHVHLLMKEEQEDLSTIMRRIGASYVYWYNMKYERCGHLFQDRFKSEVVESERYFLTALRYIHQNPLKAGIVKDIDSYKWSSYREYLRDEILADTGFAFGLFSNDRKKAEEAFVKFHQIENDDECLDVENIKRIKDEDAKKIIRETCDVKSCSEIQNMERKLRDGFLHLLKKEGLSTRQLARLTGVGRGVIVKA